MVLNIVRENILKTLRTPDSRFEHLDGFSFKPNYCEINDGDGGQIRIHYLDEGASNGIPILLMHGEPSWCYLYRKMIPGLVAAGYRVLVPDLIGFGRSDKPVERGDYSYQSHVDWMTHWLNKVDINRVILFCQDWGGLIGLRLVAENTERFTGVVVANTFLPTGDVKPAQAFLDWQSYSQNTPDFAVGNIINGATVSELSSEIIAGYDAPFPDDSYKAGARQFPLLVPITSDDPSSQINRKAWKKLASLKIPFLTAFSDQDPITFGGDKAFQNMLPGCENQKHIIIEDGGHFLQEDKGEQLSEVISNFISDNDLGINNDK